MGGSSRLDAKKNELLSIFIRSKTAKKREMRNNGTSIKVVVPIIVHYDAPATPTPITHRLNHFPNENQPEARSNTSLIAISHFRHSIPSVL